MNAKGSRTSIKITPDRRTRMEKSLPASLANVISPNPSVLMTVKVQ